MGYQALQKLGGAVSHPRIVGQLLGWETDLGVCKILADEVVAAVGVYKEARCWQSTVLVTPTTGTLL